MAKYLDYTGLTHYDEKIKEKIDTKLTASADSFTGADGVTVALEDSKVKISGSGCVQKNTTTSGYYIYTHEAGKDLQTRKFYLSSTKDVIQPWALVGTGGEGELMCNVSASPKDNAVTNKKYCDNTYVKKYQSAPGGLNRVYGQNSSGTEWTFGLAGSDGTYQYVDKIAVYGAETTGTTEPNGYLSCHTPSQDYQTANKVYVDNAIEEAQLGGVELKTIFGNQSLIGEGNIDLYKHTITVTNGTNINAYLTIYSSKNLIVDSLTDLKTLLGDTFTESCTGMAAVSGTGFFIYGITESNLLVGRPSSPTVSLAEMTISDTVTTI